MRTITLNLGEWTLVRIALENLAFTVSTRLEEIQRNVATTTEFDLPLLAAYTHIHDKAESYGALLFTLVRSDDADERLTLPFDFVRTLPIAILHLCTCMANGSSIVDAMSREAKDFLLKNAAELQHRIAQETIATEFLDPEVVRELFRWTPASKPTAVH